MDVTIAQMQEQIEELVERAAKGEDIALVHKDQRFRLVPVQKASKLSRIQPLNIINGNSRIDSATQQIMEEIQADWVQDWSEISSASEPNNSSRTIVTPKSGLE